MISCDTEKVVVEEVFSPCENVIDELKTLIESKNLRLIACDEVIVAVLDSGVDLAHRDLIGKVVESVNFTKSETEQDVYGHGTHVSGIIVKNAPQAKLLNVKVVEDSGIVWTSNVTKGIIWAVDHNAKIINMSFILSSGRSDFTEAMEYANRHGVIMITSSQSSPYLFCHEVIRVGKEGAESVYPVDFYAPGTDVYSALPNNLYGYKSGSSMSVAYVSSMMALIIKE